MFVSIATSQSRLASGDYRRPVSKAIGIAGHPMTSDEAFYSTASLTLGSFRSAVEQVVYALTKTLQSSRSLQSLLGIDLKTSYQVYKLLGPVETMATVQYVPAAVSFKKMLAAARKQGVSTPILDEATAAYGRLERYALESFGDFEAFELAVMSYADFSESSSASLAHRKAAFKADVYFHGFSVEALSVALFFHPGKEANTFDFVGLRQMVGLRRLRAGTDVVIDRWRFSQQPTPEMNPGPSYFSSAFDEQAAAIHDAAVLPEFCSQPMLPLATTHDESGNIRTVLKHRDLGVGSFVDLTTGRVHRGAPIHRLPDGRPIFSGLVEIGRPTKLQIIDTFVHRPTWPNLTTRSGVFAHYFPRRSAETIEQDSVRLPFSEQLVRTDSQSALRLPEAPRHTELLRHACDTMGWRMDEMEAFRFRIEYPLMDTNIQCVIEATEG